MKESAAEKSTGKGIKVMSGQSSARPIGLDFPRAQHTWERLLQWVHWQPPYPVSSGNGLHLEKEPSSTLLTLWWDERGLWALCAFSKIRQNCQEYMVKPKRLKILCRRVRDQKEFHEKRTWRRLRDSMQKYKSKERPTQRNTWKTTERPWWKFATLIQLTDESGAPSL